MLRIVSVLVVFAIAPIFGEKFAPYPIPSLRSSDLPQLTVVSPSCPPPNTLKGIDLVVAMDSSASVGQNRYEVGIEFIERVVASLKGHVGTGSGQTQMAMFLFDDMQITKFEFNSFTTSDQIVTYLKTLENSDQNGTDTLFIPAVAYAHQIFSKARGGQFQKVLLFVSDGWTDENEADISQARLAAEKDGVTSFLIHYPKDISKSTANALVGSDHMSDRVFSVTSFNDVAKLTGCNIVTTFTWFPTTTGITTTKGFATTTKGSTSIGTTTVATKGTTKTPGPADDWYCLNGGAPGCHCPPGYTGKHCEAAIDSCHHEPTVNTNGTVRPINFCHHHGHCIYDIVTGSSCVCDPPYTGKWCEKLTNTGAESDRCIAYDTDYTLSHPNTTVQTLCNYTWERCIPDNIDCMFNVPIAKDDQGRPYCKPPAPNQQCKCKYPIGWCIPLEPANNALKYLTPNNAFVDPYFKGSWSA